MTPLDDAHEAMDHAPDDDQRRVRFFETLANAEVFVLLEDDTSDTPRIFETEEGPFVLIFDLEDRLTDFTQKPAPYAAMSGRAAASMIHGQGVGLALNLGVAPSSLLIPVQAIDWLQEILDQGPLEEQGRPTAIRPPDSLPESFLNVIDTRLASAEGLARAAYLVTASYEDSANRLLLAIVDALPGAETALTRTVSEAVQFSGEDLFLDVAFFPSEAPIVGTLERLGLKFDLPQPSAAQPVKPDPTRPPKLR